MGNQNKMDKGRIMDNAQNNNARFVDNYGQQGKTSVKTSNPPGGKSSFSLGWSENDSQPQPQQKRNFGNLNQNQQQQSDIYNQQPQYDNQQQQGNQIPPKTGVRVKQAPGGNSQITFG